MADLPLAAAPAAAPPPPGAITWDQAAAMGGPAPADAVAPPLSWDEAAKLPPAKGSQAGTVADPGMGANLAAAGAEGVAAASNITTDPVGNIVGTPLDRLFPWAYNLGSRIFGYTPMTDAEREAWFRADQVAPQGGTAAIAAGAHAVGLPAPSEVAAVSPQERVARAALSTAVAMPLTMGASGVGGVAKAAAIGSEFGAAGQSASELVPEEWKDPVNFAVQMALPFVHAGVVRATAPLAAPVRAALGPTGGRPEAILDPTTGQPITATADAGPGVPPPILGYTPRVQRYAAQQLADRMGQTPGQAAATMANAPASPVAGSVPTLGQATGDIGTLSLERELRNTPYGRTAFAAREAANQVAQVRALQGVAPPDIGDAAGNWFRTKLEQIQAADDAQQTSARQAATQTAADTGATGVLPSLQDLGETERNRIEADREPLKAALGKGYDALDPDGTLAQDTTGYADAAQSIRAAAGKRPDLFPGEADRFADAQEMRGVTLFSALRQQQSNLAAILKRIRNNPEWGPESQAYRRMSQLMAASHDAISAAAARAVERASGTPGGAEPILSGLQDADAAYGGAGAGPGGPGGEVAGVGPTGAAGVAAGAGGAATPTVEPAGGPGVPPGDRAVSPQAPAAAEPVATHLWRSAEHDYPVTPTGRTDEGSDFRNYAEVRHEGGTAWVPEDELHPNPAYKPTAEAPGARRGPTETGAPVRPRRPQDFLSWVISKGGVKPDADLTAQGADAFSKRFEGRLVNPNGKSLNELREMAQAEGWTLKDPTDDRSVKNMIHDSLQTGPIVRGEDQFAQEAYEQHRHAEAMRAHSQEGYRNQVLDIEDRGGMRLSDAEIDHAVNLMTDDPALHPEEAVRLATIAGEQTALDVNAQRNAFGRPGIPQAEQDSLPLPLGHNGGPPLEENYPPTTARDLRDLNRRYADYKNTYRSGAVGTVLQAGKGPGGYKLNASSVPLTLFKAGPGGAEAADSLIKQAGSVQRAQEVLGDAPALLFRNEVMPSGVVDPQKFQTFQNKYAAALAKFPDLAAKFRTAAEAQRTVERAAMEGKAKIEQFQRSAAAAYLTKAGDVADSNKAIGRLLNSENPRQSFRQLMQQASGNQPAIDGIKRNLLDVIQQRAQSTREAGTSGVKALAKNAYQRTLADPRMAQAIDEVLAPNERRVLRNVSDDMDFVDRGINATRIPGSPATAADLRAMVDHGGLQGASAWLLLVAGEKAAEVAGWFLGLGPVGRAIMEGAGMLGANTLRARRATALGNAQQLMTEMTLQPSTLGRVMMERLANHNPQQFSRLISHRLMQAAVGTAVAAQGSH